MIKVWGRATSSNVQKVMWAIGELGLEHSRIDIGGPFGGNDEASYRAMNPNGLVPTVQDGDLILWESNAIVRHLARTRNSATLQPKAASAHALAEQWMDWQGSVLSLAMIPAFVGLFRTPPEKRDAKSIAASQAKTIDAMAMLEARLARVPFVAGADFSMGDIPVGIMAYRFWQVVPDHPPLPHLKAWYTRLRTRPAFRDHVEAIPLA
jgi:glutathione S-transferase